jgi:HlyD family secretion protein
MPRSKKNIAGWLVVVVAALAAAFPGIAPRFHAEEAVPSTAPEASKQWSAAAAGRVETASGEIKIASPIIGRIAEVLVRPNDVVFAGELLVRLDDEEALARLAGAEAQAALRKRARNDQSTSSASAERRRAEDAVADAERTVFQERTALDETAARRRAGTASDAELAGAQSALVRAHERRNELQEALRKIKTPESPLSSRVESELDVARAELALARAAVEKTRIRAPLAGTVLQIDARKGELAIPTGEPLVLVGDLSALRVRAEVDERNLARVRVGQRVLIRASAFRGREFEGRVASIAQIVGPGRINARNPRKAGDGEVVEVLVQVPRPGPLVVGLQVDVYFSADAFEAGETQ